MTILVTGGTGKTGRRLAARLETRGIPFRIASRRAPARFDWADAATWDRALDGVSAVYLVAPSNHSNPGAILIEFFECALQKGCERFVLLSASALPPGGPGMGEAHAWLMRHSESWAVLRPTWFMENFSEGRHVASIRTENAIYTAAGDGRVAFVSAEDIAECALAVLTASAPPNADFILTSTGAISHDEAAEVISRATGRTIAHRRIEAAALAERFAAQGLPAAAARLLSELDRAIAAGAEARTTDAVQRLTGQPPVSFADFVAANAGAWAM